MDKTNESRLDSFFQILSTELASVPYADSNPAVQRQLQRMRKRAKYTKPQLENQCLDSFEKLNLGLLDTVIKLDSQTIADARHFLTNVFENFNTRLNEMNIQETLDESYLYDLWQFGPGASNGVKGSHVVDKISQRMTCTNSCEPLVLKLRSSTPYFRHFDMLNNGGTTLLLGSKLMTVPKNEDTVRVIAIEPSGNMALQLAAGNYMTEVLRSIGLNISEQQVYNKALAKYGSETNRIATIDLKSASDMFTPELIRLLFPEKWYDLLMKIRSPQTTIRGKEVPLNMISTMGNGFTFPLMTLCLVALIYAYRAQRGGPNLFIDWRETSVYGDDIIIPVSEYLGFTALLQDAGLIVNYDKSYSDGPFRESCGGDYHNGVDITPFYVTSLAEDSTLYVAINQVLGWSGKSKLYLPATLAYLKTLLKKVFFVPEWSNPDQGILTTQVKRRYKFLQPAASDKPYNEDIFMMPLACGGYIFSSDADVLYTPRQYNTRYVVGRGRLPNGFLSGRDPLKRVPSDSATIDLYVFLSFFG